MLATHCIGNNDIQSAQLFNGSLDGVDAVALTTGILILMKPRY